LPNYLVIGGGFLGSNLGWRLVDGGHAVTVYSRSFLGAPEPQPAGPWRDVRTVRGELPRADRLEELIAEADLVFYMAGVTTPAGSEADPAGMIGSSVVPATSVFDLMRRRGPGRIVIASSGGTIYGEPRYVPTDEDHPLEPASLHGHNSLTIERYAEFFARRDGLEVVVLRYSNPYGPGQRVRSGQGVVGAGADPDVAGRPITVYGALETRRDLIYIDDAVEATILAASQAAPNAYNVGSGASVALGELLDLFGELGGGPVEVDRQPARGVDVTVTELDSGRLEREVGWRPTTPLREGLRRTLSAARDAG
jgi:UDP-glucose 4-epimerase